MYALVDCNNFYASCERVFRPDLIGKPIVVLSNNDGCVIARSNESKALGVPMGAPAYQNEELFEKHSIHVFSANFALYGDMSSRVMSILAEFCPEMEIYSIDEAFLNLDGFDHVDLAQYGKDIHKRVLKCTGIPVSVGIAPTKSLAKLANRIAKKYPDRTGNAHVIDSDEKRVKALKWLKVEDVWGIGRQHAKRLNDIGVITAFDFTMLDDAWVKKNMAIVGLRLKHDLQGIPMIEMEDSQPKKSIATTRTFEKNYSLLSQLQERVATFAVSCAEKLRAQNSCCNTLMVFVHTNGHRKDMPQYSKNIVIKLPFPTNSNIELSQFAIKALDRIFLEGFNYKKAGVMVSDFSPADEVQFTLFENSDPRHASLMQAMDKLNASYGHQKIKLASQELGKVWKMKQEKLSPRYTTSLSDIITINV